jgi:hypothetical protein
MRRVAIALTLVSAAALGCAPGPTPKPDAATDAPTDDVADAPEDGAAGAHGDTDVDVDADAADGPPATLVIRRLDGTPVPPLAGYGGVPLVVEADGMATGQPASAAQWTATGACQPASPSVGSRLIVGPVGAGVCTLTATAGGTTATATYTIVYVSGVKIDGDTSPMIVGERRTFTAVGLSGTTELTGPLTLGATLFDMDVYGDMVTVTATAIGEASLFASLGDQQAGIGVSVVPASLELRLELPAPTGPVTTLRAGDSATVVVTAFGLAGVVGQFDMSATGLTIKGADGFGLVVTGGGSTQFLFLLLDAVASSPSVTATYGTVVSNALSFSVTGNPDASVPGPFDASVHDALPP